MLRNKIQNILHQQHYKKNTDILGYDSVYWCFGGTCVQLYFDPEDKGSMFLWNIGIDLQEITCNHIWDIVMRTLHFITRKDWYGHVQCMKNRMPFGVKNTDFTYMFSGQIKNWVEATKWMHIQKMGRKSGQRHKRCVSTKTEKKHSMPGYEEWKCPLMMRDESELPQVSSWPHPSMC